MITAYRLDLEEADVSYSSSVCEEWKQKIGGYYTTREIIWDKLIAFLTENPNYLYNFIEIHSNYMFQLKDVSITISYHQHGFSFDAKWKAAEISKTSTTEKIIVDGKEYNRQDIKTDIGEFKDYSDSKIIHINEITISEETSDSKPESFTIEKG